MEPIKGANNKPLSPTRKYENVSKLNELMDFSNKKTAVSSSTRGSRLIASDEDKLQKEMFYRKAVANLRVYLSILRDALKGVFKAQKEVYTRNLRKEDKFVVYFDDDVSKNQEREIYVSEIKVALNTILKQIGSFTYIVSYAKKGNHSSTPESFKGVYSPVYVHAALKEFMLNCELPDIIPPELLLAKNEESIGRFYNDLLQNIKERYADAASISGDEDAFEEIYGNFSVGGKSIDYMAANTLSSILRLQDGALARSSVCIRNLATLIFHLHSRAQELKGVEIVKKGFRVKAFDHARFSDAMQTYFNGNVSAFYTQVDTNEKIIKKSASNPTREVIKMKKQILENKVNTLDVLKDIQQTRVASGDVKADSFSLSEDDFNIYFFNNMASVNYSSKKDINELWDTDQAGAALASMEDPFIKAGMLFQHNLCYLVAKTYRLIEESYKK